MKATKKNNNNQLSMNLAVTNHFPGTVAPAAPVTGLSYEIAGITITPAVTLGAVKDAVIARGVPAFAVDRVAAFAHTMIKGDGKDFNLAIEDEIANFEDEYADARMEMYY